MGHKLVPRNVLPASHHPTTLDDDIAFAWLGRSWLFLAVVPFGKTFRMDRPTVAQQDVVFEWSGRRYA